MKPGVVDLAGGEQLARLPDDGPRAGALALVPAVEHRPDRQGDGRDVDRRRGHQAGGRGLVAADGQHHPVERIAVEHLDQAEIGQVAVQRGGRPLAGLLDRMHRELDGDAAGLADALAHPLGQHQVVAVARRQVRAGLGDADDRLVRLQLLSGSGRSSDSARDRARSSPDWPDCRTRRASAGAGAEGERRTAAMDLEAWADARGAVGGLDLGALFFCMRIRSLASRSCGRAGQRRKG